MQVCTAYKLLYTGLLRYSLAAQFRSQIMSIKTYLQMLLSLSVTSDKTAVQPAGSDIPLELSATAFLSQISPGENTLQINTWPQLDTLALMPSVICISEQSVKVRGKPDPSRVGTGNFLPLALLFWKRLASWFSTHPSVCLHFLQLKCHT